MLLKVDTSNYQYGITVLKNGVVICCNEFCCCCWKFVANDFSNGCRTLCAIIFEIAKTSTG